jgi:hypothetical protein
LYYSIANVEIIAIELTRFLSLKSRQSIESEKIYRGQQRRSRRSKGRHLSMMIDDDDDDNGDVVVVTEICLMSSKNQTGGY